MSAADDVVQVVSSTSSSDKWSPVVGDATSGLKDYLVATKVVPSEAAEVVITEACRILSQCVPPGHEGRAHTGLVCGFVQSGKTASMTAVSALAKDNGYRIIIFLAGVTTNLVGQNRARLEEHLRACSSDWAWMMLNNPKLQTNAHELNGLVQEWRNDAIDDEDRRTLFVSVMKHHSRLRDLAQLLASVNLDGIPAIVFDDEADQASLNTRPSDPVASATYRNIEELRSALPHHTFLQYTATPQAPLLITRIDSLSADFAELVSPGENYTGGGRFFEPATPYVETIPQAEVFRDGQLPGHPPASLIRAMQLFFVGVAAGKLERDNKHRSMLVHPSKATATHQAYVNWVNGLKTTWHDILTKPILPDRDTLLEQFRACHAELAQTENEIPSFVQIQTKLPVGINQTAVTLVNSKDGREVPWANGYAHILVGGEKLGRGYTVKGLTVTYMPRPPGGWTADTIQQRARFFGYHSDYLGYCRVFLHPDVRTAYVAYIRHEQDMRKRLEEHRGKPLRDWRRLFYLDRRLAPTRRNVLSSPYLRPRLQDGWFVPLAPHMSPEGGAKNLRLLEPLTQIELTPHVEYAQHHFAVVRLRDVFERIFVPLSYFDEDDALRLCVVNCNFKTLLDEDADARCLVYFMDHGKDPRKRTLSKGVIKQLFQGRSSKGAGAYPGDRAFADQELPTVQIHILRLEEGSDIHPRVPALAVKLRGHQEILLHDD